MSDDVREQVLAVLRSKQTRDRQVDALLALVRPAPELLDYVHVSDASRAALCEIEAYGLVIGLDAADRAVTVEFPAGATVPDE
jgi:hypothetical protein